MDYKTIERIRCEDPWQKMWDHFFFFETEPTVRSYLEDRYAFLGEDESRMLAYRNTHKLIFLSKQAREFFNSGNQSSHLVRPLLYYYGMVNLTKMVILSRDPYYPSHTALLAHGVTTRKIKKTQYVFLEDEVKIQKEGLLPHLFHLLIGEKNRDSYKMSELLSLIPDLTPINNKLYDKQALIRVQLINCYTHSTSTNLLLPKELLQQKYVNLEGLSDWINHFNRGEGQFYPGKMDWDHQHILLNWKHPEQRPLNVLPNGFSNWLFLEDLNGQHYFWPNPQEKLMMPELIFHFLIMYLLSMLCRYEGDLWGDLHFSFYSQDIYLIHEFLQVSARKFPNLILNVLFNANIQFQTHD